MIFASHWFLVFAAIFFAAFWLLRAPGWRAGWLLAACAVFHYHYAGPAGVLPIIVLAAVTYLAALTRWRAACWTAATLCGLSLVFYKYTLFLSHSVLGALHPAWGEATAALGHAWLPLAPPLAISFFVFEFVHYLIEVGRGGEPIRRPGQFALFAIFFPSLVAGPIKRYRDFGASLHAGLGGVGAADVAAGLPRVALGFFKKLVLADNLTAVLGFYEPSFMDLSAPGAWLFLAGLAARILLDFSGYTDIAIGLAQMMGIRLPENFRYPYVATSLRDFWGRWHISLTTWIRDYVYIPLGGSRHGVPRRLANGFIAFVLCGLWHGPAWHFALWGVWHGAGLAINTSYRSVAGGRWAVPFDRWPVLGWLVTMWFVTFGWLLFFYEPGRAWMMAVKLLSFR